MITISPPGRAADSPGHDETPLLSLTHFSRPPFVSLGCVQPGSSRSAVLLLHNPSPDPAQVTVHKLPRHRGFSVPDTDIYVPPFESFSLTITWTPLEEGGIRELVTFVVNDIVKHQAVLLGHAELPSKKKRARWNTKKNKYSPLGHKVTGLQKKDLCSTVTKNKTFCLKSKNGKGVLEVAKNPLQPCENVSKPVNGGPTVKKGRRSTENKSPTLHVSPLSNDLQTFIPGSLKRSKTYSVLCETIEEVTTTSTIHRDFVEEQWTLTEHRVNKLSLSPINPVLGLRHNFTCTPSLVNDFKTLSPTEFYNAELTHRRIDKSSSLQESFHECFTKISSNMQTPPSVLLTPQRKVLSPDSFVNNSYVSQEYLDAGNHTPVLSPDQFVKENFLTPPVSEEVRTSQFKTESANELFTVRSPGNPDPANSRLTFCVKKKKPENAALLSIDGNFEAKINEKPPINSATITKVRSSGSNENLQRPQLKSRRRLKCVELEDKAEPKSVVQEQMPAVCSPDLPTISVSIPASSSGSPLGNDPAKSICGYKRKSAQISYESSGASSESLNVTQAKKSHVSKPAGSQRLPVQEYEQVTKIDFFQKKALPQLHSAVTFKHSKKIVAVPQSKLTFIKPAKTVIPRHPMPFAAKNMFYDERWMAKQERGFTWWLNFILTPDDFAVKTDSMKVNAAALILGAETNHKISVPKAPTKEEVSLKAYTARCRLNRLRRSACRLFTSDPVVKAIRRLEIEIEARRLLVRKDRHLWKDVGERQKILNWLLSYNPLWLRVGLETIFGELISLEGNSDITGLALFILNRLLWNPDIAAEYRHPSVPHLYRDGHEEALSKFTLKKLLLLVFFLDYAKQSRLIDHDPCLFCKDAEFKTSKDLLLAFSRDFLSGEGDLSRHLGYLGLPVSHAQTPLDEFDFAVTNLAVDLQCGVRLVRTMELLTHNWSLSKKLRVPAISRLQKMHNIEVALQVLADRGVQIKDEHGHSISSRDIVDRHRERTLALLWNIVFSFQVEVLLNVDHLMEEIKFLKHSYSTQKRLAALRALSFPTMAKKRESNPFSPENYSDRVLLLMEWVNAVCAFYNTKVENFTVSFSDGRVFCYLINHYHPSYVALDAISQRTTQTIECNETGTVGLNSSSDSDNSLDMWSGMCDQGFTTSALYKELLDNERTNFSLLQNAVSNLGGIPAMIYHSDTSNTIPDEKIVITFLSFLCGRLLDIRKEARAARVIQAAWRKYKLKTEEHLLQKKQKAASVIQNAVRKFLSRRWILKRTSSAVVIQKNWRRYLAYKELLKLKLHRQKEIEASAAIRIWRCFADKKYYITLRKHVIVLQARIRTKIAVSAYKKTIHATKILQRHVRSWLLAKRDRQNFLQLKSAAQLETKRKAATVIQSFCRMYRERCKYLSVRSAAVKIQSLVKMRQKRIYYLLLREKVIFVQTRFRANLLMHTERKSYLQMRTACVKIQSTVKGHLVRKQIKQWHKAATTLQANYRMHMARKEYLKIYRAAVIIQERFRAYKLAAHHRELFLLMKISALRIQAVCRDYIIRKRKRNQHLAALSIQSSYRCYVARKRYILIKNSAIIIQKWYREQKQLGADMERFWKLKSAITAIQAAYRGWVVRKQLHKQTRAVVTIQSAFRRFTAQRRFREVKMATLTIQKYYCAVLIARKERQKYLHICLLIGKVQAIWRGKKARKEIRTLHKMATRIQSCYRMYVCYTKYKTMKQAAMLIQCHYRAYIAGKVQRAHYLKIKGAASCLQAAYRGWQIRKHLLQLHNAVCTIQASYRSFRLRKEYLRLRMTTIVFQRRYRAKVAPKLQREQYLLLRKNTIKLQSIYRGMRTRQRIIQMRRAAVLLQSVFKMQKQRAQYRKMKAASSLIQEHYRAMKEGRKHRQQYLALRKAACTLQSAWRGKKTRGHIYHMHTAATVIQAWYRMVKQRHAFQSLKKATVTLQQRYRASQERKKQLIIFTNTKKAVLCIQSTFRAAKLQREFRAKRQAAVVIQRAFKSFLARRRFLALKKATVSIQRRFKWKKLAERQRQDYLRTQRAALVLQAAFRGFQDRQKLQQMRSSATVIQAAFRMHKERVAYEKLKQSAITIQQYYRAFQISAHKRDTFLTQKKSAVIIQSAYRGAKVRQRVSQMNKAAIKIQATFRMHQCRIQYKKFLWAACVIQQRYRANKQRDFDALRYSFIKSAALVIQAAYRGWCARKGLRTMNRAATIIQRQFRTHLKHKQYLLLRSSALLIQRRYRATVLMHHYHSKYQSLRKAAICMQASYKGVKVRKNLALKHAMAKRIQFAYRNYKTLVLYRAKQDAARKIQAWYKSIVESRHTRASFLKYRWAAIVIQSSYKGMKVRKNLKGMIRAATIIQKNYRMYFQKKYYTSLIKATKRVQKRYRAIKARERDQVWYQTTKNSAILLQAAFRGMKVRRRLQRMNHAATAIQKFVKGYLKRKAYLKLRSATVCLQKRYKALVLARFQRLNFLTYRQAVVCIQSAYRGYKARQRLVQEYQTTTQIQSMFRTYSLQSYADQRTSTVLQHNYYIYQTYVLRERQCSLKLQNAAVVLQASYRGMKSRRNIRKMQNAAIVIQASYRMHRQRRSYLDLLWATRTIQCFFRATLLKNEAVKQYNVLRKTIISIQRSFRARKSREVKAAVVIQTTWKMYRERRAFIKTKSAVVSLQAIFRGYRARKRYKLMMESVCRIQCWYKRCHQVRVQRLQYLSMRTSAIIIQSSFRCFIARKHIKRERAARVLQSYYRMAVCRKRFLQLRASAIKLQTYHRMQSAIKTYKRQRSAAVIIQQWYKSVILMRHQRSAFLNTRRQIICMQAAVRRFNAQRSLKRLQHAALMSQIAKQNTERRLLRFASAVHHHLCAVKIQRWFRAHLVLKRAQKQIYRVIYIQRWYRSRLQRSKFLCTRQKIIGVQRVVRAWLHRRNEAAVTIQRHVRLFLLSKRQVKITNGIVKFQALWRGYQWRKVHDTKKLQNLRNRLRKVSEDTKAEDKLCNRTLVALNYLLSYKHFSYILAALKHLEAATRLSAICCENMAQSGAVKIIFTLIRSCNRSIPCMEVIRLSIQVLLNLTKYEKTVSSVYEVEDSVEVLLDLMQIYREKPGDKVPEKGGSIFTKTCCLLAIFGLDSRRAEEIRAIPKAMNRITSIHILTSRKHKMDTARNVSKQLMNSSRVHSNASLQATPMHTRIVSRIKPDWVLRKDNMREIVDPLQAIQLVMSTFGLPI
uniref:Calponin-homology (CH) domain-containing protein n=1 Tax=Pyxicephalus adspersus TaxID=30357 RepID=A0AAV2ZWG6_PYXAD|nr:TPA: hypothetical protein GDO54_016450 [Pyxicephalus adspersus]